MSEVEGRGSGQRTAADATLAAFDTYEAFAAIYDDFTYLNDYERWLGTALLPQLEKHGLRHGALLDVGCGIGRAFAPMLKRGWRIVGCDISPAMLAKAGEHSEVELHAADMRDLPTFGEFELVLCLNDAVNYLLGDGELRLALAGMARNMSSGGLLLFDCNSTSAFRAQFLPGERKVEHGGRGWTWTGLTDGAGTPGAIGAARIDGDDIEPFFNRERHYPPGEVEEALRDVGLQPLATLGMRETGNRIVLDDAVDETRDYKFVCIARLAST
jgi:SAM-dependent methyltransferase